MFADRFMRNRSNHQAGSKQCRDSNGRMEVSRPINCRPNVLTERKPLGANLESRRGSFNALAGSLEVHSSRKPLRSSYSSYTRAHALLPHRYTSKVPGLQMDGYALTPSKRQYSQPQYRDQDKLQQFSYVKLPAQKVYKSPCKKLELLGHTEEKMRDLLLSKATRSPLRYFDFDIQDNKHSLVTSKSISKERVSSAGMRSHYEGSQVSERLSSAGVTKRTFEMNQGNHHLQPPHRRTVLPSLDEKRCKLNYNEQSVLNECTCYCPGEEDMTDLDKFSDMDSTLLTEEIEDVEEEEQEEEEVEEYDDIDCIAEEEDFETKEMQIERGNNSRVVFKRHLHKQKMKIEDMTGYCLSSESDSTIQEEEAEESSTSLSYLASPSSPQVPLCTHLSKPDSLRELPSPHVKYKDGSVTSSPPLTPSLFPQHIPPSIHFPLQNEKYIPLLSRQQSLLKYKNSPITPNIVKSCLARVGYTKCSGGHLWTVYWGKHMGVESFKDLKDYQKVNHFPGTFQIGRKDKLWQNLSKMAGRCGKKDYDFFPQTYILPHDVLALKKEWEENKKQKWIVKPPASARGIGIKLISQWAKIPKKPVIVQRYIGNPYLINGMKFDLRVYVYVTSYDPLRIYIYREGLTRFATCKYSKATRHISNKYMHLTNYSINKRNSNFTPNTDENACQGHKWGLLALWKYMNSELSIDTDVVWESIKDVIVKTIICSEDYVSFCVRAYVRNHSCVHELFGFDILLDHHLKPWVLEVNISPSLHSNSQLDVNIKGRLVRDMFNIASLKLHSRDTLNGIKGNYRPPSLSPADKMKHAKFLQRGLHQVDRKQICDYLSNDDLRVLMIAEDELSRCGSFERAFPTLKYEKYRRYFENEKYYNMLLGEWIIKYEKCPKKGIEILRKLADQSRLQFK